MRLSRFMLPSLLGLLMAAPIVPPEVPENLKAPATEVPILKASAKGKQIYSCKAKADNSTQFEWVFDRPDAELFNESGGKIGKHYVGPTWEAKDGSKVMGQVLQRGDAPRAGAVAWLLIKAKSTEGKGTFARVTYIQRVNTKGGAAPATGCDGVHSGTQTSVDYEADYYFYARRD